MYILKCAIHCEYYHVKSKSKRIVYQSRLYRNCNLPSSSVVSWYQKDFSFTTFILIWNINYKVGYRSTGFHIDLNFTVTFFHTVNRIRYLISIAFTFIFSSPLPSFFAFLFPSVFLFVTIISLALTRIRIYTWTIFLCSFLFFSLSFPLSFYQDLGSRVMLSLN